MAINPSFDLVALEMEPGFDFAAAVSEALSAPEAAPSEGHGQGIDWGKIPLIGIPSEQPVFTYVLSVGGENGIKATETALLIGEPGAGKTQMLTSLAIAYVAAACGVDVGEGVLGLKFNVAPTKPLCILDLEQPSDTIEMLMYRLARRAEPYGISPQQLGEWVKWYNVMCSDYSRPADFLAIAEAAAGEFGMVVVDGALELTGDFNDLKVCYDAASRLRRAAAVNACPFFLTLHPNKGSDESKVIAQGHAGSYLAKFSRLCLNLIFDKNTGIRTVTSKKSMGKASHAAKGIEYWWDWPEGASAPQLCDTPEGSGKYCSLSDFFQYCADHFPKEGFSKGSDFDAWAKACPGVPKRNQDFGNFKKSVLAAGPTSWGELRKVPQGGSQTYAFYPPAP
jgi:hypothetical protein